MEINIDPVVSNYIDIAIGRERKIFKKDLGKFESRITVEFKNEAKALREGFQDDIKKAAEMIGAFATKTDARDIAQEEIKPLETKINLVIREVGLINQKLA